MSTYSIKLGLAISLILTAVTILLVLFRFDWKSASTKPQKTRQRSLLLNSKLYLNDILIKTYPEVLRTPPLVSNNIYHLIQYYQTTLKSNNISNYTYKDVGLMYTGPIVEGWPPTKSRNVSRYISKQTVINGLKNECSKGSIDYNLPNVDGELKLLIMQHSSPTHFEARQSSRNTWMKLLKVSFHL